MSNGSEILQLNCLTVPYFDPPENDIFAVEVINSVIVDKLRDIIHEKVGLIGITARQLVLYKVSIADNESLKESLGTDPLQGREVLRPTKQLSVYFPAMPEKEHVHILVKLPSTGLVVQPSIKAIRALIDEGYVVPRMSPSVQGSPSIFKKIQNDIGTRYLWNRPNDSTAPVVPITLLNQAFGQFVEDSYSCQPHVVDRQFSTAMSQQMCEFFGSEANRIEKLEPILSNYIQFKLNKEGAVGSYKIDLSAQLDGYWILILEVKNEISGNTTDPYMQAISYYASAVQALINAQPTKTYDYPCLILAIFGAHASFSGAVWHGRPHYQVLAPVIPLFEHQTDTHMKELSARCFGAFRRAFRTLRGEYKKFTEDSSLFQDQQLKFPYRRNFLAANGVALYFDYIKRIENHLLFHARIKTGAHSGKEVVIKYVRRYSKDAHETCAQLGFAPCLRGFEILPGGWIMVVMDNLSKDYINLFSGAHLIHSEDDFKADVKSKLGQLHKSGFVHGDVRNANIMIRKDGGFGFMLLDFDWSGKQGEVKYPININRESVKRPNNAVDGNLILAEDDIEMVDYLFPTDSSSSFYYDAHSRGAKRPRQVSEE